MSFNIKDIEFTTYNIGTYPAGFITHIPTGLIVHWETNKSNLSTYREREKAFKELERLIEQHENNT